MSERLLIVGGLVIDPARKIEAVRDLLIEDGRVKELAAGLAKKPALKGVPTFDAKGQWVVPGLVDMHCHFREPGREADETIATGAASAAAGGVTTALAMANTEPVTDNPSQLRGLRERSRDAAVNVLFAAAVTVGQKGEKLTEFARLKDAGAAALSDDGQPIANAGLLRRALEYAKDLDLLVIDHCEDKTLSDGGAMNEGAASLRKGLKGATWAAEAVQVVRDIELARLTGARLHIAHISTSASVESVRAAKKNGVRISAEACPHHFVLTDDMIPGYDGDWKMNPPLRSKSDREALLEALADGTIDAIATDHAPHGCAAKCVGLDLAPFGVIGLETSLALGLTELVNKKVLPARRLVELMSTAPAALLGLKGKGTLAPGATADIAVVDPAASWMPESFVSKSRNSPFTARRLKGRAIATFVAGRQVHAL